MLSSSQPATFAPALPEHDIVVPAIVATPQAERFHGFVFVSHRPLRAPGCERRLQPIKSRADTPAATPTEIRWSVELIGCAVSPTTRDQLAPLLRPKTLRSRLGISLTYRSYRSHI